MRPKESRWLLQSVRNTRRHSQEALSCNVQMAKDVKLEAHQMMWTETGGGIGVACPTQHTLSPHTSQMLGLA